MCKRRRIAGLATLAERSCPKHQGGGSIINHNNPSSMFGCDQHGMEHCSSSNVPTIACGAGVFHEWIQSV